MDLNSLAKVLGRFSIRNSIETTVYTLKVIQQPSQGLCPCNSFVILLIELPLVNQAHFQLHIKTKWMCEIENLN